jgi:hypothetical protein
MSRHKDMADDYDELSKEEVQLALFRQDASSAVS